jgi:hypothetical protein
VAIGLLVCGYSKNFKVKNGYFSQKSGDSYVINLLEDINYIKHFAKYLNSHLCVSIFALF